jgi:alpha-1,3-rhamnosyl/mannosyltransferase
MKIILETDSIVPPLTGIGRYTWELASRLRNVHGVDTVRYLYRDRWIDNVASLRPHSGPATPHSSRSRLTRAAYRLIAPVVLRQRLKAHADHIFHGPNFYLPAKTGRSVATIHDLSVYRYPEFHPFDRVAFMRRQIPLSMRRADFLITVSEFTRQEVISHFGWPQDKIKAIPLGVDLRYRPRTEDETRPILARHGLSHGGYLLCTATIEPRKNIDRLLTSFEQLPHRLRLHCPLVLIGGSGWRNRELMRRIESAQGQGWLHYLGYVPESELPYLTAGAYGFLFPSMYEGFGLPVLEAMACGIPVVTSNAASLPEVTQGSALLVNPLDVDELACAILRCIQDGPWRREAAARGRGVAQGYSWATMAQKTVDVYRMLEDM